MSDEPVQIRAATSADWAAVRPVLRALVDEGETYDWAPDIDDGELRAQWFEQPGWSTFVAVDAATDRVLGIADVGPNRGGRGSHVANASFVVAPDASGRGIGRALGCHVVEEATRAGFRALQFNAVVETNVRAVALWQSLGFSILATVPEAFDHPRHGLVGLHVMHRMLASGGG